MYLYMCPILFLWGLCVYMYMYDKYHGNGFVHTHTYTRRNAKNHWLCWYHPQAIYMVHFLAKFALVELQVVPLKQNQLGADLGIT